MFGCHLIWWGNGALSNFLKDGNFLRFRDWNFGSPHYQTNPQKAKVKETIIEADDLSPELWVSYDEAISEIDKSKENSSEINNINLYKRRSEEK